MRSDKNQCAPFDSLASVKRRTCFAVWRGARWYVRCCRSVARRHQAYRITHSPSFVVVHCGFVWGGSATPYHKLAFPWCVHCKTPWVAEPPARSRIVGRWPRAGRAGGLLMCAVAAAAGKAELSPAKMWNWSIPNQDSQGQCPQRVSSSPLRGPGALLLRWKKKVQKCNVFLN